MNAIRPPPKLQLSKWIEQEIRLPPEVAAQPGPIRLFPFQREIADAMGDPAYERVSVLKAARVGYSTLLSGVIGSYVANDPATVLCLLPREEDARTLIVSQMDPTFAASPNLAACLAEKKGRNKRNRLLHRVFPGGWLKAVAATSEANLRSHNARVLIIDEVDAMEETKEGSPVDLAIVRTKTFDNRKIIMGSTPVKVGSSHIMSGWEDSDQRVYECPCPHCGDFHELHWKDIRWPKGDRSKAAWWCPSCGTETPETHKGPMVAKGRWRVTKPEVKGHAGYRLNALISPLRKAAWPVLAKEWEDAQGRPDKLKAFINTALGEPWQEEGEEFDEDALAASAEDFSLDDLPPEVLAITCGVDVQRKDRLEVTFIGWDRDGNAFILGHKVIWGLPTEDGTWQELDTVLAEKWRHPLGGEIGVEATCVDSGDGATMETVYDYCYSRFRKKVFAVKGDGGRRPFIAKSSSKANKGRLWIVGVDSLKTHLYTLVTRSRTVRFSKSLPLVWFEQFASERMIERRVGGKPVRRWERIKGKMAEALDCTVYAFAAKELININWDAREEVLRSPELAKQTVRPKKPSGPSFMERIGLR